jgi:hypothetical protein
MSIVLSSDPLSRCTCTADDVSFETARNTTLPMAAMSHALVHGLNNGTTAHMHAYGCENIARRRIDDDGGSDHTCH